MPREISKDDYTDEELLNLKAGKCWCGKPKKEFDKHMRVYCSYDHRKDWYERTIYWSEYKDRFLAKRGKKCAICGCTPESKKLQNEKEYQEWMELIKGSRKAMKEVEARRFEELNRIENRYKEIMNDDYMIKQTFGLYRSEMPDNLPLAPIPEYMSEERFEVDHIVAVSLGGDMWDEDNLQVLCYTDHKEKTKKDMEKLRAVKKKGKK